MSSTALVHSLGSALAYLGAAGLILALLIGYVRALTHPAPAPVQRRRTVRIGGVMLALLVTSLVLDPRGSTALLTLAAAVLVATNLDLLRREQRTSAGPQDPDAHA